MIEGNTITEIFRSFEQLKVLIIGDVMTDHYVFGDVKRISPEAPIPIVDVYKQERRLGGAANVALNVKSLGATPILVSVVGDDDSGHQFKQTLQKHQIDNSHVILDQERVTSVKSRVISRNQQLLRYDDEKIAPLESSIEILLLDEIIDIIYNQQPHVIIFQDYNKGVLTQRIIANVIHNAQQAKIPVAVDPKYDHFFDYKGCTLIKPNLRETKDALNLPHLMPILNDLFEADLLIRQELSNMYSIITLSEKGIYVGTDDDRELIPADLRQIVDVSGAGDTVISIFALGLALGLDIFATAELANLAAALVCEKVGVVPVDRELLMEEAMKLMEGI